MTLTTFKGFSLPTIEHSPLETLVSRGNRAQIAWIENICQLKADSVQHHVGRDWKSFFTALKVHWTQSAFFSLSVVAKLSRGGGRKSKFSNWKSAKGERRCGVSFAPVKSEPALALHNLLKLHAYLISHASSESFTCLFGDSNSRKIYISM